MRIESAVKIIIVLLMILIVSVAAMLLLIYQNGKEPTDVPPVTTTESQTTEPPTTEPPITEPPATEPSTTEPPITEPPITEPPITEPPITEPPITEPPITEPPVTEPPITEPPADDVPDDFSLNKVFRSESGTLLNLRAEVTATAAGNGKVKVTVSLYLEHYTLYLGRRDGCYLTVDGNKHTFTTDAFNVSNPTSQVTLLASHEVLCDYGETVSIGAYFPCRCEYGRGENAKKIDALTIDATLTLE